MGVAFMVVVPMLYCDVTDSWRLPDRRQRMAIDAAGIVAEAVHAVYASLAWVLLPEGSLRTGAFLVATASMVSSLLINLNPMMRFDGYLLMADALAVPNLQAPRLRRCCAGASARPLFDLRAPKPDQFTPAKQRVVIAYAAAIVCYRAVVYAGIALLVYHATFKLLGIALFAVEVGWFLVAPVWKEIAMWWRLKQGIRATRRSRLTGGVAAAILLLLVFPFRSTVVVPAVLEPAAYARIFPTTPAMVKSVSVHRGDDVAAGSTLVTLVSPQNERDRALARIRPRARRSQAAASRQRGRGPRRDSLARHRAQAAAGPPGRFGARAARAGADEPDRRRGARSRPRSRSRSLGRARRADRVDHGTGQLRGPRLYSRRRGPGCHRRARPAPSSRTPTSTRSRRFAWRTSATPPPRGSTSPRCPRWTVAPYRHGRRRTTAAPRISQCSRSAFRRRSARHAPLTRGAVRVAGARESIVGGMLRQVARVLVRESGF